ncbi:MAG: hypothetical protein ACRC0G_17940 [Fusobacteriaceae bacterium]
MKLIELLNKRKIGEELTEEELIVLREYDESVAIHITEIERMKTEKELAESKLETVNIELKNRDEKLTEQETLLKKELEEKESMKKILENTTSTHEARLEMEKQKAEKIRLDELGRQKAIAEAKKEKEEAERNLHLKELSEIKEKLAINDFEKRILAERIKRPYLEKQLTKVLLEIPVKGLDKSEMALEILFDVYIHDEEMVKWEANKNKSTDIFGTKEVKLVGEKVEPTITDDEKHKAKILEFAKKNGFKVSR